MADDKARALLGEPVCAGVVFQIGLACGTMIWRMNEHGDYVSVPLDEFYAAAPVMTIDGAAAFPNRTWPWRPEDDGDPEALAERLRRPEPPYRMEGTRRVYLTPKISVVGPPE